MQIRTELQDLWAQVMEALADRWGNQIKYGGLPNDPEAALFEGAKDPNQTKIGFLKVLISTSKIFDAYERGKIRDEEDLAGYGAIKEFLEGFAKGVGKYTE